MSFWRCYWETYKSQVIAVCKGMKWWMLIPINWIALVFIVAFVCPVDAYFQYRNRLNRFIKEL